MKKLFALLLSVSMILGIFSISALAISEDSLYNVVMRRGPTCASCNMREMRLLHTSHEPWILSHYEPCSYGSPLSDKYNDTIKTRLCVATYQCDFAALASLLPIQRPAASTNIPPVSEHSCPLYRGLFCFGRISLPAAG